MSQTPRVKMILKTLYIGLVLALSSFMAATAISNGKISIRMPDIRPDHAEQYLCMAHRVKPTLNGEFIVGFNPKSDAHRVHHMLMYGCQLPGIFQRDSPNFVWDCSEMHAMDMSSGGSSQMERISSFEEGPICTGKQQILYGWALDAPSLRLPDGVGFKIGGLDSNIDFLVLQVHYGHYHVFEQLPSLTDNSGLVLDVVPNDPNVDRAITKRAGVLLLVSLGYVPEGKSKHEIFCEIKDDIELHPFRFRVHTHKMGTRVKGVKIGRHRRNSLGYELDENSLIGVGDPQKPQMFYPVRYDNMTLVQGDKVYATCEFNNNKSHPVKIGMTGDDEMCNFYMMYWTDSPNLLADYECFGRNPPESFVSSLLNRYAGQFLN